MLGSDYIDIHTRDGVAIYIKDGGYIEGDKFHTHASLYAGLESNSSDEFYLSIMHNGYWKREDFQRLSELNEEVLEDKVAFGHIKNNMLIWESFKNKEVNPSLRESLKGLKVKYKQYIFKNKEKNEIEKL